MSQSESIGALAKALSQFQGEVDVVKMNAVNPFFTSKYADLGSIISTARNILSKYGLSVTQFPLSIVGEQVGTYDQTAKVWVDDTRVGVRTMLLHESGEWISEDIYQRLYDQKGVSRPQLYGIVISYLKRYAWAAVLGMYAEDDLDGSIAESQQVVIKLRKELKEVFESASEEGKAKLKAMFTELGYTNEVKDEVTIKNVITKAKEIVKGETK